MDQGIFRVVVGAWGSATPNIPPISRAGKGGKLLRNPPPSKPEDTIGARVLMSTGLRTKAGVLVQRESLACPRIYGHAIRAQPTLLKTNFHKVIKQTRILI